MQERMQILNLLEEGKVSVDEAVRLLKALGERCCEPAETETHEKNTDSE